MRRALRSILTLAALCCAAGAALPPGPASAEDEKPAARLSADDLKAKVAEALERKSAGGMNEALRLVTLLGETCGDAAAREAAGFDALRARTVEARDAFFRKAVRPAVVRSMGRLVEAKAREKVPPPAPAGAKPAPAAAKPAPGPVQGTFAAARSWAIGGLGKEIRARVRADLGISDDEFDRFWKERSEKTVLTASYGGGSFLVFKALGLGAKSEEEWWDACPAARRAEWLTAWFVETSGLFEVTRTDESEKCGACGGHGVVVENRRDGSTVSSPCSVCNGAGKTRKIEYR